MEKLREKIDKKLTDWQNEDLTDDEILDVLLALFKAHVESKEEEIAILINDNDWAHQIIKLLEE
jgi:hypothetical protein